MSFITTAAGIATLVGAGTAAAGGLTKLGMSLAGRRRRIEEQQEAKALMEERMGEYESLDTSNIYANVRNQFTNMENVYEDVTVNQQQAQFEAQQGAQQRADIMNQMRGAAGSSGIAALAQAMANQGQIATQRASASIGAQEARIQQLRAGQAGKLQQLERTGAMQAEQLSLAGSERARGLDYQKTGTLLGISQQRLGAANKARAMARAQQMSAVGDIAKAGLSFTGAMLKSGMIPGSDKVTGLDLQSGGGGGFLGGDLPVNPSIGDFAEINGVMQQWDGTQWVG